jgi:hypothetical protein
VLERIEAALEQTLAEAAEPEVVPPPAAGVLPDLDDRLRRLQGLLDQAEAAAAQASSRLLAESQAFEGWLKDLAAARGLQERVALPTPGTGP